MITHRAVAPIIHATLGGNFAAVQQLLQAGADANSLDRDGRTALHQAALDNQKAICLELLQHHANIDAQDLMGFAPLHLAAQEYAVEAAQLLVNKGAKIDIKNKYGNTPLFTAVFHSKGRGGIIEMLLMAGSNPDSMNASEVSPLKLAKRIANYNIQQFFKKT